jgi:hypothetical protein
MEIPDGHPCPKRLNKLPVLRKFHEDIISYKQRGNKRRPYACATHIRDKCLTKPFPEQSIQDKSQKREKRNQKDVTFHVKLPVQAGILPL